MDSTGGLGGAGFLSFLASFPVERSGDDRAVPAGRPAHSHVHPEHALCFQGDPQLCCCFHGDLACVVFLLILLLLYLLYYHGDLSLSVSVKDDPTLTVFKR